MNSRCWDFKWKSILGEIGIFNVQAANAITRTQIVDDIEYWLDKDLCVWCLVSVTDIRNIFTKDVDVVQSIGSEYQNNTTVYNHVRIILDVEIFVNSQADHDWNTTNQSPSVMFFLNDAGRIHSTNARKANDNSLILKS